MLLQVMMGGLDGRNAVIFGLSKGGEGGFHFELTFHTTVPLGLPEADTDCDLVITSICTPL